MNKNHRNQIINHLLTRLGNLTNSELVSKDNFIHILIEPLSNKHRSRNSVDQNNATSKPDINHGQKDVFDESKNAIKAHVKKMKNNNSDKLNERSKQNQNMTDTSDSQCLKKKDKLKSLEVLC